MATISRRKFPKRTFVAILSCTPAPKAPSRASRPAYVKRVLYADSHGIFRLGPNDEYTLSQDGLEHIYNGDLADQVIRKTGQPTSVQKVLKGGLHTLAGWERFKNMRQDVVHGATFRSDRDTLWYFARELQNGVVLLKIPRALFQSNAAKLTLSADFFYKSGYLWKTLFPQELTRDDILAVIDESLFHLVEEESDTGIKIGYALLGDPLKALKVRIQVTGSQLNSAFPTWGQPATGNNGKPYSHSDSIGFPLAESTVFFGDKQEFLDQNKHSALGESVDP